MDVELEHGTENHVTNVTNNDPIITGKIALAHLNEFPDYYTRLQELEDEAEKYWENKQFARALLHPNSLYEARAIVEATEEQIMNELVFWRPINQLEFYPLVDSRELGNRFRESRKTED